MNLEALSTLRHVENAALKVVHTASTPAALAHCSITIVAYLDARLHAEFQQAVRDRYEQLTKRGTPHGPP